MTRFVREILPIEELARQDRVPGRYPTTARLGDNHRRGDNAVFFDDTQSVMFRSTLVSAPTMLPASSSFIADDLKSSILLNAGTVTKTAVDQFVVLKPQTERFRPFNEANLQEQNFSSSSPFQSGSAIADVGAGFTSRLRDKTILRLELPVKTTTRLVATGGYYYNYNTQTFDPVALERISNSVASQFTQIFGGSNQDNIPPLFSCLGTQFNRTYQLRCTRGFIGDGIDLSLFADALTSLLQGTSYVATGSIPGRTFLPTQKKFVMEKAVLELPFSANSGWLNDSTQQFMIYSGSGAIFDGIGGPAITVSLLNQISPDCRDVIMSGTIVPANDLTSWFNYQFVGGVQGIMRRQLGGFTNWSTPAAVVSSSNGTFTGSVSLKMTSAVANGYTLLQDAFPSILYPFVASRNPFGRAMNGQSGRAVFGREFACPPSQTKPWPSLYDVPFTTFSPPTATSQTKIANQDQNATSPYLFNPSDNLLIYVTAPQPALSASSGLETAPGAVTASHYVTINSGTIFLTMYGSEIANAAEFHDTLNQRLETNEVHETVGFTPVLDQFEVAYSTEYSGSMIDRFRVRDAVSYFGFGVTNKLTASNSDQVYSNFNTANDQVSWSTQREWSSGKLISEIKKNTKAVGHFSEKELFWDSRVPDPFQIMKIQQNNFRLIGFDSSLFISRLCYTGLTSTYTTEVGRGLGDFLMAYPFEGRYASITPKFTDQLKGENIPFRNGGSQTTFNSIFVTYDSILMEVGPPGAKRIYAGGDVPGTVGFFLSNGMSLPEFTKVFYGIGDGVSSDDNQYVTARYNGSYSYTMNIRGWRHGMLSAFPTYSKAIFRQGSYGQFRDMLEQRPDSKYLDTRSNAGRVSLLSSPVTVKFVDSTGQITLPEYTYSSNLSTEVTSSVPYIDGKVRNREEPIQYARLNQSVAII